MPTILIVDDVADIRLLIRAAFRSDVSVLEASNGEEGLSIAERYHPDLIITDENMNDMTGIDFVRSIRALFGKAKIIGHSDVYEFSSARAEMIKAGADVCLPK